MAVTNMLSSAGIFRLQKCSLKYTQYKNQPPNNKERKVYLFVPLKKTRSIYKTNFAASNALKIDKYQNH